MNKHEQHGPLGPLRLPTHRVSLWRIRYTSPLFSFTSFLFFVRCFSSLNEVFQLYTNSTSRCYFPHLLLLPLLPPPFLPRHLVEVALGMNFYSLRLILFYFFEIFLSYFVFVLLIFYISCGIKGQIIGGSCVCDNGWGGSDYNLHVCTGAPSPLPFSLLAIDFYTLGATKFTVIPQGSSFTNIHSSTLSSIPAGWLGTTFDESWYVLRM